jgi:hypothetical protein
MIRSVCRVGQAMAMPTRVSESIIPRCTSVDSGHHFKLRAGCCLPMARAPQLLIRLDRPRPTALGSRREQECACACSVRAYERAANAQHLTARGTREGESRETLEN